MKKQIFLTGMLTLALLMSSSPAKAQGWPTFDVAKLASLISNLIGRFQPIPQVLSRVNQVKSTMAQVQAAGKAAMAGGLKDIGKKAAAGLQSDAFNGGRKQSALEKRASGANGATGSSQVVKSTLFASNTKGNLTIDERNAIEKARKEYKQNVKSEVLSKSFYMAMNGPAQSAERFEKATEVMQNAETIQDSINANTMMIMAGNFERMNRIVIDLSKLKQKTVDRLDSLPVAGYTKPKKAGTKAQAENDPDRYFHVEMGESEYVEQEKDEADVDF